MNIFIGLFRWYGLAANSAKYRIITCQPSALRSGMSEEAKEIKCMGVGTSYPRDFGDGYIAWGAKLNLPRG